MQVIPLLIVDRIELSLPFWVERLGFESVVSVPEHDSDGERLAFIMLQREGQAVELQTRRSLATDLPALAPTAGIATVYISVDTLAPIEAALSGYADVLERRETWYGRHELVTREPSGHFVIFGATVAPTPVTAAS